MCNLREGIWQSAMEKGLAEGTEQGLVEVRQSEAPHSPAPEVQMQYIRKFPEDPFQPDSTFVVGVSIS